MLAGTDLSASHSLFVAETGDEFIEKINACFYKEFKEELDFERKRILSIFDNEQNAARLINEIF